MRSFFSLLSLTSECPWFAQFLEAQLQRHEAEIETEGPTEQTHQNQMALLLRASRGGKSDTPFNLLAPIRDRIKQICQSIIAAGSDTTGTTLTALFYFLLHEEDAMHKLLAEVDSNSSSMEDENQGIFSLQMVSRNVESKLISTLRFTSTSYIPQANDMPFLNACIKEALRLHPAVAFSLPRIVPTGGSVIAGQYFAAGVSARIPLALNEPGIKA